ncbi:MAG: hypothetical protein JWQ54_3434 [Mucilaginibacter sp.]|nr:hypothetical protein [Mucilaginibacter sp.]
MGIICKFCTKAPLAVNGIVMNVIQFLVKERKRINRLRIKRRLKYFSVPAGSLIEDPAMYEA